MIEHEGKQFRDDLLRPYEISRRALSNYYNNECEICVCSGLPEGVGKSNYLNHAIADIQGYLKCKDKEKIKWMWQPVAKRTAINPDTPIWEADYTHVLDWTKYLPIDMVDFLLDLQDRGVKVPLLHWDDGGTHLNSAEYNDPFVVSFMEFLPLARSVTGMIVITTPVVEWVLKKLHTASGVILAPITKEQSNDHIWRKRKCKAYTKVKYPNKFRSFPRYLWTDYFSAIVPDSFYKKYQPIRDKYAKIATANMKRALEKKKRKNENVEIEEAVLESKLSF